MEGIQKWLRRKSSTFSIDKFAGAAAAMEAGLTEGIDLSKPIFQSRVFKQFRNEQGFNKRHMVLYPGVLVYYTHERDYKDDVKAGKLTKCRILKLTGLYLTKVEEPPARCRYCFNLHLPDKFNDRNQMLLVVKSRKLKKLWMTHLQAQNPHLVMPSSGNRRRRSSSIKGLPVRLVDERHSLTGNEYFGLRRPSLRRTISF